MCGNLVEDVFAYFSSDKGQTEILKERRKDIIKKKNIHKYIKNFHSLDNEKRCEVLRAISEKILVSPVKLNNILEMVLEYSLKYGEPLIETKDLEKQYLIEGCFVVTNSLYAIYIDYKPEDIFAKDIEEEQVSILKPSGEILVSTNNQLVINDILIQIKQKKVCGYSILYNGKKYVISSNGHVKGVSLFPLIDKQLKILTEF